MKPIFCLGDICADLVIPFGAAQRIKRGKSLDGDALDVIFSHGGSTANTAAGLAKLGIPVQFCGTCGDDAYGHALRDELFRLGVDVSALRMDPSVPTLLIAVVVDESGERTAFATQRHGASQHRILADQIPIDLIDSISWLHCGGVALREDPAAQILLDLMQRCYIAGIPVSLDISARLESIKDPFFIHNLKKAASFCTVLFGSVIDELPLLSGSTEEQSIKALTTGGRIVVARDGARGAVIYTEAERLFCPAFSVPVVDTIGAGDAYNAGFLAARMRNLSLAESNRYANATAAYCVMHAGGRACPDPKALSDFLRGR